MALRLYNTLTRGKDDFVPIDAGNVRMYVCGPTVYDFAHIGNARPVIVFDVLYRLLRHLYGETHVTYVRNITDVDDKINARAARDYPGVAPVEAIRDLTEKTYAQFEQDVTELGCLKPTVTPRATEHIAEMIAIIERLIAGGFAYVAEGHALFHVPAMPDYGKLARRSLDDMMAGARVEVAPYKRDPMDFVLWKPSSDDEPGWQSPWGRGRPGWHIECSAMSWKHLGETFDIHGGGVDLVFPHHENEVAQSRCAFHKDVMANVFMHNGFLQVEGEKMSKSLGNFFTIRELLDDWPGEVLRFNMLKTHYRQPIDFTVKGLEEGWKTLDEWYAIAADVAPGQPAEGLIEALSDDLNTAKAIAELHAVKGDPATLSASLRLLGFLGESAADWASRRPTADIDEARVNALIAARLDARKAKNFAESDRIRDELAAMGVVLKDTKNKDTGEIETSWDVKR
ncbi:cysteine--tRNA ligase [Pleomorphomonas diazotrophica]|uniref:Cysteine--tRNA ligase n=1 Tax=Pleomorphomonas diazotrophica TaxID=1166257 RepID=A0A1I4U7T0_9HYPH|nr:cysteine--tRNA ligase [Pleomorphomonas diazotrophica]PKR91219.1 cysteine--tRNA ligase [Pleomorphomonas diazotrophica]SFM85007.1 cysteinyl-tRNA synthetase [Pleomorphomonas diazotrophica]